MLYSISMYNSVSGIMLYNRTFNDNKSEKYFCMGSLFSVIKQFSEIITENTTGLKCIRMKDFILNITSIDYLNVDIIIITDTDSERHLGIQKQ